VINKICNDKLGILEYILEKIVHSEASVLLLRQKIFLAYRLLMKLTLT